MLRKGKIYFTSVAIILLLGALFLALINIYALLIYVIVLVLILLPLYLLGRRIEKNNKNYIKKITDRIKDSSDKGLNKFPVGIIILDSEKNIEWANNYVYQYLDVEDFIGSNILDSLPEIKNIFKSKESNEGQFSIGDKFFRVKYQEDSGYLYLFDITEIKLLLKKIKATRPALISINIDNWEEISDVLEDVDVSRLDSKVTAMLTDWAKDNEIFLKRVYEDRFIAVLNSKSLNKIEKEKFSILDDIRNLKEEFDTQVTLSMGIGFGSEFLPELGELAKNALELSLGRGGDQVAIKEKDGSIRLYGGKTNPQEKRTRLKAKTISNALADIIKDSDKIFVMGHIRPDFDAIGACIAIYEFALLQHKTAYIILNDWDKDDTIHKIMNEIEKSDDFNTVFITSKEADELLTIQSTLVVVDTSDKDRVIDTNILAKASKKVVIDHHRRGEDIIENPLLTYIEPYASSTSELLSELFEYQAKGKKLDTLSATLMLGGIVVDTQNFSVRTGSRTFDAAAYLRSNGADPIKVKTILKEPLENFRNRAEIINASFKLRNDIVVSIASDEKICTNVMLAQAADLLLTIQDVEASFVIGRLVDGKVGISARSLGDINVQVLMEALGGGGHLTNAATQIEDKSLEAVRDELIYVINKNIIVER